MVYAYFHKRLIYCVLFFLSRVSFFSSSILYRKVRINQKIYTRMSNDLSYIDVKKNLRTGKNHQSTSNYSRTIVQCTDMLTSVREHLILSVCHDTQCVNRFYCFGVVFVSTWTVYFWTPHNLLLRNHDGRISSEILCTHNEKKRMKTEPKQQINLFQIHTENPTTRKESRFLKTEIGTIRIFRKNTFAHIHETEIIETATKYL